MIPLHIMNAYVIVLVKSNTRYITLDLMGDSLVTTGIPATAGKGGTLDRFVGVLTLRFM